MFERLCAFCSKYYRSRSRVSKFCSVPCSNRANRNNTNYVTLPTCTSENLAELFGILAGDGSVTKYYLKIYLNRFTDAAYWPNVVALCKSLFPDVLVSGWERPTRGTYEIQISSRAVSEYLLQMGFDPKKRVMPSWIVANPKYARAAVRGLIDTDGTIGIKRYVGAAGTYVYAQITFTNRNANLLQFVEHTLIDNGFKPTRNAKKNIYISNARDIDRYMLEIGSSNPKFAKKLGGRVTKRRGARAV